MYATVFLTALHDDLQVAERSFGYDTTDRRNTLKLSAGSNFGRGAWGQPGAVHNNQPLDLFLDKKSHSQDAGTAMGDDGRRYIQDRDALQVEQTAELRSQGGCLVGYAGVDHREYTRLHRGEFAPG